VRYRYCSKTDAVVDIETWYHNNDNFNKRSHLKSPTVHTISGGVFSHADGKEYGSMRDYERSLRAQGLVIQDSDVMKDTERNKKQHNDNVQKTQRKIISDKILGK
jgi:hypothetical protein